MYRTNRLVLRRWRQSDYAPFAAINADARAMRYMPSCLTRVQSDAWVERIEAEFEQDGFGLWALELISDGRFIGFTGLNRVPFQAAFTPAVEIGWRLAPAFWGEGYATEAARAALRSGFGEFGLTEIVAETATANLPSRKVMQRIGMRRALGADFAHPGLPTGHELRPHVLYRALAGEFRRWMGSRSGGSGGLRFAYPPYGFVGWSAAGLRMLALCAAAKALSPSWWSGCMRTAVVAVEIAAA